VTTPGAEPVVSVVVPAFDAVRTVDDQLAALARQRPSFPWEILLCDNGSRDGTADAVRRWIPRLPQLALVDASARRGPSAARNIGAARARGSRLVFCDADDVAADDWVERLAQALERSDIVVGAGETGLLNDPRRGSVSWSVDSVITKPYWPRFPAGASSNMGVRTSLFHEIGGFDETLRTGEDIDLCWRVQLAGGSFARAADAVVHIRKRTGLRAVYRQAFSYAVGDRQLQYKYREQIAVSAHTAGGPVVATDQPPSQQERSRIARALRLLRPSGRADLAWRLGERSGSRSSRVEPTASAHGDAAPGGDDAQQRP
jgi:glycosyltransferase involved in cell wall biosynthesis